jgi:hypothetical protein
VKEVSEPEVELPAEDEMLTDALAAAEAMLGQLARAAYSAAQPVVPPGQSRIPHSDGTPRNVGEPLISGCELPLARAREQVAIEPAGRMQHAGASAKRLNAQPVSASSYAWDTPLSPPRANASAPVPQDNATAAPLPAPQMPSQRAPLAPLPAVPSIQQRTMSRSGDLISRPMHSRELRAETSAQTRTSGMPPARGLPTEPAAPLAPSGPVLAPSALPVTTALASAGLAAPTALSGAGVSSLPSSEPPMSAVMAPAAPMSRESRTRPTGGDVYLDGIRMGQWIADYLTHEVVRPQSGSTGFDPRLSAAFPGTLQGPWSWGG